jgi:transmembrane sensor
MSNRETAATIDAAASLWAGRIDRGLIPVETEELEAWLSFDERHLGALSRAEAAWIHAERAGSFGSISDVVADPDDTFVEQAANANFVDRRRFLVGGGALAASVAALVSIPIIMGRTEIWKTAAGEVRQFKLDDGSLITLDTESELSVSRDSGRSELALLRGRASFSISSSLNKNFSLKVRDLQISAKDVSFVVTSIGDDPLAAVVTVGQIAIKQFTSIASVPLVVLRHGMKITVPKGASVDPSMIQELSEEALVGAAQWQAGLLMFTGDSLGEAALILNRYGGVQIEVPDRALASEPITGVFRNSDAIGFATAVATMLDARLIREKNKVIIVKR